LIEAYQDIPVSAWLEPLSQINERQNFLNLRFFKDEVREYALAIAEEEDSTPLRWSPYCPGVDQRAISLGELDAYFIADL
jgi:hypothetical protein